jgi:acetyl-CoA/propionyl-CoA carboxylase biotin carboxyl carrier protein
MPAPGTIKTYQEPRWPWVRVDSACFAGYQVLPFYDSLLAKLIVWGRTREEAIARGKLALSSYIIEGLATTIPFHLALLNDPTFVAGRVDTKYVEAHLLKEFMQSKKPETQAPQSAESNGHGNSAERSVSRTFEVEVEKRMFKVAVTELVSQDQEWGGGARTVPSKVATAPALKGRELGARPDAGNNSSGKRSGAKGEVRAAMHGVIKQLYVKDGDAVEKGQKLLIFEAMKMESEVVADHAGKVSGLKVKQGETVEAGSVMLFVGE